MKGEYARLARGSYLYFSAVFLFSCKVAQVLPPLRPLEASASRKNALTSGRTDTVKVYGANRSDVPPRDTSTRLPRVFSFAIPPLSVI